MNFQKKKKKKVTVKLCGKTKDTSCKYDLYCPTLITKPILMIYY